MKYTAVILIFLGMASATKLESSSLAQIQSTQQALIDIKSDSESSDDDSDSNDDETNI
jgi:lipopolysaccharide export system protein LptA